MPKLGIPGPFPLLTVFGFSALGFLPAVVVQSVLRGEGAVAMGRQKRSVAIVAYVVSVTAAILHVRAAWSGDPLPSSIEMRLLTYTFIGLVLPLALVTRGQPGARRALWAAALSIFAVSALGHRIDAIRLTHERYERQLREQEIGKLATEAELRALRSQINPHFLFNALTTIGYLIQTAPDRALETLMRLTSLLRGVLRSENEFTTLGREMELVESYLDIERARFEQRLRVRLDVPAMLKRLRVPPLLLQPVVENVVKHGIAPERRGGEVTVTAPRSRCSRGVDVGPRRVRQRRRRLP